MKNSYYHVFHTWSLCCVIIGNAIVHICKSCLHKTDQRWWERQSCASFSCRTLKLLLMIPNENITSIYLNYKWLVTVPNFKFWASFLTPLVGYFEVGKSLMVVADIMLWQEGMESSPCLYLLWGLDNLQITSQWLHFWRQLKTKLLQVWMSRRMRIGLTRMWWKKGDSHLLLYFRTPYFWFIEIPEGTIALNDCSVSHGFAHTVACQRWMYQRC